MWVPHTHYQATGAFDAPEARPPADDDGHDEPSGQQESQVEDDRPRGLIAWIAWYLDR